MSISLEMLATEGVDGLSMQKIAAAADPSNPPLYGRYDAPEDIVIDLWGVTAPPLPRPGAR